MRFEHLLLIMVLCLTGIFSANAQKVWDGTTNTDWYDNGSASQYTITTAEELAGFAELVNSGTNFQNKTITLGTDILLNDITAWESRITPASWNGNELILATINDEGLNQWTPISDDVQFKGTFDGNGKKIAGLCVNSNTLKYTGLFGWTASSSVIKNVSVVSSFVKTENSSETSIIVYAGGLVGHSESAISNCYSTATVSLKQSSVSACYAGGLVGYQSGATITSCHSSGDVSSSATISTGSCYIGGLAAGTRGISPVINSSASGNIYHFNGSSSAYINAGGLLGNGINTVANCSASADVVVSAKEASNIYMGGLVGVMVSSASTIYNSFATGNVLNKTGFVAGIGGLVGEAQESISNCYSAGKISIDNLKMGSNTPGGLIGRITDTYNLTINNSYYNSTDNISGEGTSGVSFTGSITAIAKEEMQTADFAETLKANAAVLDGGSPRPSPLCTGWNLREGKNNNYPFLKTNVVVLGITVNNKTYDGTKNATFNIDDVILLGVAEGDDISLDISEVKVVFFDALVATNKSTSSSGEFAFTGDDIDDYNIIQPDYLSTLRASITEALTTKDVTLSTQTVNISVYPNPAKGLVNVAVSEESAIKVFDITGKIVNNFTISANSTGNFTQSAGLYFVRIESNGKVNTEKVIIE